MLQKIVFIPENTLKVNQILENHADLRVENGVLYFDSNVNNLQYISLHNDEIKQVVFEHNLPDLVYLNLAGCSIEKIEFPAGCCQKLKALHLENNSLQEIVFGGNMPALQVLGLNKNRFSILKLSFSFESLQYIDVSENKNLKDFSDLSKFVLRQGFDFSLRNCHNLVTPPASLVKQGLEAVRDFYRQQRKYGKAIFNYAKILIVGEGAAGKTTLRKLLFNRQTKVPDPEQKMTLGVDIGFNRIFKHPTKEYEIQTSVWDFGGQEFQYNIHHYFLSEDALYILMTDRRKEGDNFYYWFQAIEAYGGENVPIIVVQNVKEDMIDVEEKSIEQYKRDFPRIAENIISVKINLAKINSEYKEEWDKLEQIYIPLQLEKLKTVNQEGILLWNEALKEIRQTDEIYLKYEFFYDLLKEKYGLQNEDDYEKMLDYLYRTGLIIYYKDDTYLSNFIFIKPQWITENIYSLFEKKSDGGIFKKEEIDSFWKSRDLNREQRKILFDLLGKEKFDVAYPIDRDVNYLAVPEMFEDTPPEYSDLTGDSIVFKYEYERFIPKGVFSRFVVRMYEYIEKDENGKDIVWKTGVILNHNNTRAEIIATTDNKTIKVKITGEDIPMLRTLIIENFDKLLEKYPVKPKPKVPCTCNECSKVSEQEKYYFSIGQLQKARNKGRPIQCQKSLEDIDPNKLLEGYDGFFKDIERERLELEKKRLERELEKRREEEIKKREEEERKIKQEQDAKKRRKINTIIAVLVLLLVIAIWIFLYFYPDLDESRFKLVGGVFGSLVVVILGYFLRKS